MRTFVSLVIRAITANEACGRLSIRATFCGLLVCFSLWTGAAAAGANPVLADELLIRQVSVVNPDAGVSPPVDVLIKQGRIAAIGRVETLPERVIEAQGQFLIPGLIDGHVHLRDIPGYRPSGESDQAMAQAAQAQIPRSYLYFGFTTLVDLISDADFIAAWNASSPAPRAYFCSAITPPNAYPLAWLEGNQQFEPPYHRHLWHDERQTDKLPVQLDPHEHGTQQLVERAKAEGANCMKTFHETGFGRLNNLPVPTPAMGQELVRKSQRRGLPVLLHGNSQGAYEYALQTGVDMLVHGLWQWQDDAELKDVARLTEQVAEAEIGVQPTLRVVFGERELFDPAFFEHPHVRHAIPAPLIAWYRSDAGQWMRKQMGAGWADAADPQARFQQVSQAYQKPLQRALQSAQMLHKAGASLLFGSDTPSGPIYTQFPGLNGYREIQLWADAGIPLADLLRALTIDNARAFGLEDRIGSVAEGKVADLLLLKENPLESVAAYDTIETVILAGEVIPRVTLSATRLTEEKD